MTRGASDTATGDGSGTTRDAAAVFDGARRRVLFEDLDRLVRSLDDDAVRACLEVANAGRLDPRFIPGGAPKLLWRRIRNGARTIAAHLAGTLTDPCVEHARDLLGEAADAPSLAQLETVVDPLIERWGAGTVRLTFSALAVNGASAALHLDRLLRDHPLLTTDVEATSGPVAAEDVEEVDGDDDLPDLDPVAGDADALLFSPLDEVIIRQTIATLTEVAGSLPPEQLRQLIGEVTTLSVHRPNSYFHLGFAASLDDELTPELPDRGMNEERRLWFHFGSLSGLVRRGDHAELAATALAEPDLTRAVVAEPRMGRSVTGDLVRSLLVGHELVAATTLRGRLVAGPFLRMEECLVAVHERARSLLSELLVTEAAELWKSMDLLPNGYLRGLGIDVKRRLIACARARDDYGEATDLLDQLDDEELDDDARATVATERGLVAAEISHLKVVTFRGGAEQRSHLAARLDRGRAFFEEALRLDDSSWRPALCLGVLLAIEGTDHHRAATLLDLAAAHLAGDEVAALSQLHQEIRYYAAMERLRTLEAGYDGRAFKDARDAIEAPGWRPPSTDLVEIIELLDVHGSRFLRPLLEVVQPYVKTPQRLVPAALHALDDDDPPTGLVLRLARSHRVDATHRHELLTRLLDVADDLDDPRVCEATDVLDELVRNAPDEVIRQHTAWLASSPTVGALQGSAEAMLARAELHVRLQELEPAQELVQRVFHHALAEGDRSPFDLDELVALHRGYGGGTRTDELAELRRGTSGGSATQGLDAPVRVVFVGGDERQQGLHAPVEEHLDDRFGGQVAVEWIHPGWSANWVSHAEEAESLFDGSAALVLMPYVRTNLGRRLRRTSGEAGLPWIACTGTGRATVTRAIERAVALA